MRNVISMVETREETERLLDEYSELRPLLETVLLIDTDEPWTFDDFDCDSGEFGELVSRDFVESVENGYRLVDRDATRRALEGEDSVSTSSGQDDNVASRTSLVGRIPRLSIVEGTRRVATRNPVFLLTVTLSLAFLGLMRTITFQSVFRENHVVFPGNDPYHYRHWVDQLLAASPGVFDFAAIADVLGGRASGEPLTYVLGWWLTRLVEGSPETSGYALAWLPVIAAVVVGILIAWMALAVTEDERVAVVSVLAFAITPAHALYSGLGFADHHAIDYVWLAGMAAALVWLARDVERQGAATHVRKPGTWLVAIAFGVACAAAMLTWNGAPLLLLGVALFAVVRPASGVRTDESSLQVMLPLVGGLAVATVVTHLFHTIAGWQEPAVVYAPALVLFGVVGVAVLGELVARADGEPWWVIAGSGAVGIVGSVGTWLIAPGIFERFTDRFLGSLLARDSAVETQSLFAVEFGLTFNPIQHFGLLLLFALPALGLVTWKCLQKHEPRWLAVASYAWAMFGIALIQVRFAGEFSPFVAIFAAVGILWALSELDLCRPLDCFGERRPRQLRLKTGLSDIDRAVYLSFVIVTILTVGLILTVMTLNTIAIDDEQYDAAAWIDEDSGDDSGYVLSSWGPNRMYNYFAWGYGDSYNFAQRDYGPFLLSENPDEWHGWMTSPRDSLVLFDGHQGSPTIREVRPDGQTFSPSSRFGAYPEHVDYIVFDAERTGGFPRQLWINAVGQYQLVHTTPGDRISVFEPVSGAVIEGSATANTTVELTTEFTVNDREYTYTRETATDANGTFSIRVAYSGTYSLSHGPTIEVSEEDVEEGESVTVDE